MKWFKHDSDATFDAKIRKVRAKYGMEGYGLYWYCLELIARNVEPHNLDFELEHDAEIIASRTGIHYELVQEMMTYMIDLGLFDSDAGIITCLKMKKWCDEYIGKVIRGLPDVRTNSGVTPDKVPSNRREQKRTEEKRTERARKRAPQDFAVSLPMYEWAKSELDLSAQQVTAETKEFLDHEFKDAKKDWPAVWRNWMRRAKKWEKTPAGTDPYFASLKGALDADNP